VRAHGPLSSTELVETAAIVERYAREWLEQQAVAGMLTTDDAAAPAARHYRLPTEHAGPLADPDHPAHVAHELAGVGRPDEVAPAVARALGFPSLDAALVGLAGAQRLVVLDTCEHVLDAGVELTVHGASAAARRGASSS